MCCVSALAFVEDLTRRFRPRVDELLARRRTVLEQYNKGARPNFLAETASVRSADWKVGSIPADLQDRRVEITGPVDRKMIINALNSGASVFMADVSRGARRWPDGDAGVGGAARRGGIHPRARGSRRRTLRARRGSTRRGPCSCRWRRQTSWRSS